MTAKETGGPDMSKDKTTGITLSEIATVAKANELRMLRLRYQLRARARETPKTVRELVGDVLRLFQGGESLETSVAKVCGIIDKDISNTTDQEND